MAERPVPQQFPLGPQPLHDPRIRLQDMLARKVGDRVGEPAGVVDRRENFQPFPRRRLGVVLQHQQIVLHAVARRDMDAAGALLQRHEIAEQYRRQARRQRALRFEAFEPVAAFFHREHAVPVELARLRHVVEELFRHDQHVRPGLHERIVDVGVKADGLVGGKGPGRRGPNDDGNGRHVGGEFHSGESRHDGGGPAGHGELHVDRGRRVFFVLHLGFGQRRLVLRAPEHRFQPLVDAAPLHELPELPHDLRFIGMEHREVRVLPVAEHAETLKFFALDLVELLGVVAAEAADGHGIQRLLLLAEVFEDLMLDRQTVAVPPRHVGGMEPRHRLGLDDDVLENLVQRVADMDAAVGVGGTVVQQIPRLPAARFLDPVVQPLLLPPGQQLRFPLRQVRLHREIGLGQVQRRLIVHASNPWA